MGRLTKIQRAEVQILYQLGFTQKELASRFSVSKISISRWIKKKYGSVDDEPRRQNKRKMSEATTNDIISYVTVHGHSLRETAAKFGISHQTVRNYIAIRSSFTDPIYPY